MKTAGAFLTSRGAGWVPTRPDGVAVLNGRPRARKNKFLKRLALFCETTLLEGAAGGSHLRGAPIPRGPNLLKKDKEKKKEKKEEKKKGKNRGPIVIFNLPFGRLFLFVFFRISLQTRAREKRKKREMLSI